jgi:hypothetical protein
MTNRAKIGLIQSIRAAISLAAHRPMAGINQAISRTPTSREANALRVIVPTATALVMTRHAKIGFIPSTRGAISLTTYRLLATARRAINTTMKGRLEPNFIRAAKATSTSKCTKQAKLG